MIVRRDGLLGGTKAVISVRGAGLELGGLGLEAGLDDVLGVALRVGSDGSGREERDGKDPLHFEERKKKGRILRLFINKWRRRRKIRLYWCKREGGYYKKTE